MVVLNAGRTETDFRLVNVIAATMKSVFPNVYIFDDNYYTNSVVVATKSPSNIANFARNIQQLQPGFLKTVGERVLQTGNVREWTQQDPALVFTDDKAPVERIVNRMIVDAARGE